MGTQNLYLYIKTDRKHGRTYRYLIIEEYLGNGKRRKILSIPVEKAIDILISWCGGWDLNPRRPTPSGPKPNPPLPSISRGNIVSKQNGVSYFASSAEKLNAFMSYCREHASEETCRQYLRYLEKPLNRNNRWSVTAWKRYLRFLCEKLQDKKACEIFKTVKSKKSGVDKYVPAWDEVFETISKAQEPFRTVYKVLLESGLRVTEACFLLGNIDKLRKTRLNGFYRVEVDREKGFKRAFVAYLLELPEKIIVEPLSVSKYAQRTGLLQPKYIRKFVATQMAKLGIPDRTINFIQGRTPDTVLRKHYLELVALADLDYQKYAKWLKEHFKNPS